MNDNRSTDYNDEEVHGVKRSYLQSAIGVGLVVVLFIAGPEQRTIPIQMWSGIREEISPTILAVATILVALSILLLSACTSSTTSPRATI